MYAISLTHDENCRTKDFKNKKMQYCQIPEWVSVSIEHKAWMMVQVVFNGDTSEKFASCNFPKSLRNDYLGLEKMASDFGDRMGKPATIFTSCWDEHGNRAEHDGE